MLQDARTYLEISSSGDFYAHEEDGASEEWHTRNLIDGICVLPSWSVKMIEGE